MNLLKVGMFETGIAWNTNHLKNDSEMNWISTRGECMIFIETAKKVEIEVIGDSEEQPKTAHEYKIG